jgi:hypothetical protein
MVAGMQVDSGDIAHWVAAAGGFGGGFAIIKPFAEKLFAFWLRRIEDRASIEDAKDRAVERIAVQHERMTGVLESMLAHLQRSDARLDRMEAHMGIRVTPSAIPPPPPATDPRRQLSSPDLATESRPSPLSTRAASPAL